MNLPLVTVTWEDHNFTFGDVVPKGISRVTTTGYLVSEDKKGIIVALSISDGQPNDMQYVDKRMLVDITHITFNK